MSIESAKKFCERVHKDKKFANSLKTSTGESEIAGLIKGAGFTFTTEELDGALKEMVATSAGDRELSDDEMRAVAGGMIGLVSKNRISSILNQIEIQGLRSTTYK